MGLAEVKKLVKAVDNPINKALIAIPVRISRIGLRPFFHAKA